MQFKVYTDGSASNIGICAGAYCAVVQLDEEWWSVSGTQVPAKIGGMEIRAVSAALESIRIRMDEDGAPIGTAEVDIFTDSTYVVNCATGKMRRNANLAEWSRFDSASRGLCLFIRHTNRNTIPQQAYCDIVAGEMREAAERIMNDRQSFTTLGTDTPT